MNPHFHLLFLLLLAVAAVLFEDQWIRNRIRNGSTAKLPHRIVLTLRWGVLAAYLLCWRLPLWMYVGYFVTMAALLGPLHAIGLNLRRGKRWFYLGPLKRTKGDSAIDTIWIALASGPPTPVLGGEVYEPSRQWLPMLMAVVCYLTIALIAHAFILQAPV